jgi:putative heme-binding domain-containing protein
MDMTMKYVLTSVGSLSAQRPCLVRIAGRALLAAVVLSAGVIGMDAHAQTPTAPVAAKNPRDGDPQAIRFGTARYELVCAECHGMDAKGVFGPDLTTLWAAGFTDDRMFRIVRQGVPGSSMPPTPAGRLPDDEVWAILAYLHTLATAEPPPTSGDAVNGERLFQANCAACHRVNGLGGYLGPDLSRIGSSRSRDTLARKIRQPSAVPSLPGYKPVTLVTAAGRHIRGVTKGSDAFSIRIMDMSEQLQGYLKSGLREIIDEPRSLMPDFDAPQLSDRDLDDILRYLSTLRGNSPARP